MDTYQMLLDWMSEHQSRELVKHDPSRDVTYDEYLEVMEKLRLVYQRSGPWYARRQRGEIWFGLRKYEIELQDPMPLDLRAYIVGLQYNPPKRTFGKIIPELIKHQKDLHPFARRYLLQRLRAGENRHRQLAEQFGAVADQFELG